MNNISFDHFNCQFLYFVNYQWINKKSHFCKFFNEKNVLYINIEIKNLLIKIQQFLLEEFHDEHRLT